MEIWTEIRRKNKEKSRDNNNGNNTKCAVSRTNHGNFYATLGDGSASVFLEDVPGLFHGT